MGQLDQVSEAIGQLRRGMEDLQDKHDEHHKKQMAKLKEIKVEVKRINGNVATNKHTLEKHGDRIGVLEGARWTWKKLSKAAAVFGSIVTVIFTAIQYIVKFMKVI